MNPSRLVSRVRQLARALVSLLAVVLGLAAVPSTRAALVHQWTFNDGTARDAIGTAHGTLSGGAQIAGGQLVLDGIDDYMRSAALGHTTGRKTLVVWVSLANLAQRSGSALTLGNFSGTDVFDGIVFGESVATKWSSGSNGFLRSQGVAGQNSNAAETSTGEVMIAAVYGDGEANAITLYRNGVAYASYTPASPLITYPATAEVLIGLRHEDLANTSGGASGATGNDAFLAGSVNEARVYDHALTAAEIAALHSSGPVPDTAAPAVAGIQRLSSGTLAVRGGAATYWVLFNEAVTGVDASDFTLTATGSAAGRIASVTGSGRGYFVTVNNLAGAGTLRLDLKPVGTGIADPAGNAIAGGFTGGQAFTVVASEDLALVGWGSHNFGQLGDGSSAPARLSPGVGPAGGQIAGKAIVSVAHGTQHTVALTADGRVYAWGNNNSGQLGDGTTNLSYAPVAVAGALSGKTIVAVAAGTARSYAIDSAGQLYAWGLNSNGELGTGTTAPSTVPVVASAFAGKTIVAVSAGSTFLIALASDGVAYACGNGNNGELGDGTVGQRIIPVAVNTGGALASKAIVAVSSGYNHTLALASDGRVYGWGYNNTAPLGTGSNVPAVQSSPVAVSTAGVLNNKTVVAIAAGSNSGHSAALASDGTVAVWGSGQFGQLGNGSTSTALAPVALTMTGALAGKTPAQVAVGLHHTLVLTTDGRVYATGNNGSGQLGDGTTTNRSAAVAVSTTGVLGGPAVVHALSAGLSDHVSALSAVPAFVTDVTSTAANGTYGAGASFAVTVTFSRPVTVTGTPRLTLETGAVDRSVDYASGSGTRTLTFTGYTVQLEDAALDLDYVSTSALALNGGTITDSSGAAASLALPAPGGVGSLGYNKSIVINNAAPVLRSITRQTPLAPLVTTGTPALVYRVIFSETVSGVDAADFSLATTGSAAGTIASVSATSGTTFYVRVNALAGTGTLRLDLNASGTGIVDTAGVPLAGGFSQGETFTLAPNGSTASYAWGNNSHGQLGNGSTVQASLPTAVTLSTGLANKTIVSLAQAAAHTLALTADGEVFGWGANGVGQLGDGTQINRANPTLVAGGSLAGRKAVAIAAGDNHSVALTSDGALHAWGYGGTGQLGNGATGDSFTPTLVTMTGALDGKTVVALAAAGGNTLVLTSDGSIYGWGANGSGQLGIDAFGFRSAPVAVQSGALTGKTIVSIAVGNAHALALASDGLLYGWGGNGSGQLGDNTTSSRLTPVAVQSGALGGKYVARISAGNAHNLVLTSDGLVYGWGLNGNGQVGDQSSTQRNAPVAVVTTTSLAGKTVAEVVAGSLHSLARATDGTLHGWGLNSLGQLGDNTTSSRSAPLPAVLPANHVPLLLSAGATGHHSSAVLASRASATGVGTTVASGSYTIGQAITIRVAFSAPVFVTGTPTLTLETGAVDRVVTYVSGSGTNVLTFTDYVVQPGDNTADLDYVSTAALALNGGTITTANGMPASLTLPAPGTPGSLGASFAIVIDALAPSVVSITRQLPAFAAVPSSLPSLTYRVIFSEHVSGIDVSDFTLTATGTATGTIASVSAASGNVAYVTVDNLSGVGTLRLDVLAGAMTDAVAFTIGAFTAGEAYTLTGPGAFAIYAAGDNGSGQLGVSSVGVSSTALASTSGALAGKTVVALATGQRHVLALTADGQVFAWGQNNNGQLGDGTTLNRNTPVAVSTAAGSALAGKFVVAIAASLTHSLALASDGTIAAWGFNGSGQLGDGSGTSRPIPGAVNATASSALFGKTPVAIAAGYSHSNALTADGVVIGWGHNSYGQLGDSSTIQRLLPVRTTMTGALAGKTVTAIAAGSYHVLALASDGSAFAWGNNATGELGIGSTTNQSAPAAVIASGAIASKPLTRLAAGAGYSVAMASDGAIYGWGSNSSGQLGTGSTSTTVTSPVAANMTPLAGKTIAQISATEGATLLRATDGTLYATGYNSSGRFATGATNVTGTTFAPAFTTGLPAQAGIAALPQSSGAIFDAVLAQLPPAGVDIARHLPADPSTAATHLVYRVAFTRPVTGVDLNDFTLAATGGASGTLAAVAPNSGSSAVYYVTVTGVNGVGTLRLDLNAAGTGIVDSLGSAVVGGYSAGAAYTVGTSTAARAYAWSYNGDGQLGDGTFTQRLSPVAVTTTGALAGRPVIALSRGSSHTLALTADGAVFAWGNNNYGQLGDGTSNGRSAPVAVNVSALPAGTRFIAIAAGTFHSVALTSDGKIYTWGQNSYGQLGNGAFVNVNTPVAVTTTGVLNGKSLVGIAAGGHNSFALAADGTAYAWGYNPNGQLGVGHFNHINVPAAVITSGVLAGKALVSLTPSGDHTLALGSDGTVYGWGNNGNGQLGAATSSSSLPSLVVTSGPMLGKRIVALATGSLHTLALSADNQLFSFGYNGHNQLGRSGAANVPDLVNLSSLPAGKTLAGVAACSLTSFVSTTDGAIYAWGYNTQGQFGSGAASTTTSATPVAVNFTGAAAGAVPVGLSTASGSGIHMAVIALAPPAVSTIAATDGTFRVGDVLSIQVTFTEPVLVTGTPTLSLALGTSNRFATYASGSGTSTLVFTYTIQAGDSSGDLDYTSSSALALEGGTIQAASGTAAVLALPAPGSAGSLAGSAALVIDTTAPAVASIVRHSPTTATTAADTLTFRVTFSEPVTGVTASAFTVTGTTATVSVDAVNATTYDVTLAGGDLAALNGTVTLAFAAAPGIADLAGNALASATPTGANQNTFNVLNNLAPTDLALSSTTIAQSDAIPASTVGYLSTSDPDAGDTAVYSFVSGSGDTHNARFAINGFKLQVGGTPLAAGSYSVRIRTTDSGGLFFEKSFAIAVADNVAPVLTLPASPVIAEATSPAGAAVSFTVSASDATDGPRPVTLSHASGSTFPLGETTVTASATDAAGNTATGSFVVKVQDTTAPVINWPSAETPIAIVNPSFDSPTAPESPGWTTTATGWTVTGSAGVVSIAQLPGRFTNNTGPGGDQIAWINSGTLAQTLSATVQFGRTYLLSAYVGRRIDHATAQARIALTTASGAMLASARAPADQAPGSWVLVTATYTPAPNDPHLGAPLRIELDDENNIAQVNFDLVSLVERTVLVAEATSAAGAAVTFAPTATDAASTPTIVSDPASGATFPLGATTVNVTATDAAGLTDTASFTVVVVDTTKPLLTVPADLAVEATTAAGAAATFAATATDAVTASPTIAYSKNPGTTFPLGSTAVNVTATDAAGNAQTGAFTVTVIDTTKPVLTLPANIAAEATSAAGAVVSFTATATDAVGTPTVVSTPPSGSTFGFGATTVNVTATDPSGNVQTGSFTVTVTDTLPPETAIATKPGSLTNSTSAAFTFAGTDAGSGVAGFQVKLDDGAFVGITGSAHTFTGLADGTHTVEVRAVDAAGNVDASPASYTWTVDTLPPTVAIALIAGDDRLNAAEAAAALTISGTTTGAENGRPVTLALAGDTYTAAVASNAWTLTIPASAAAALAEQMHTVTASVADLAGNAAAPASRTLLVDKTAPAAPVVARISDDTGDSATDGITSDTTLVISGTAEPLSSVEVAKGGASIGATTADAAGAWSFDYTGTTLAAGDHAFTARATDAAGNTSATSAALLVLIDTDIPAPVIAAISTDTGSSDADGITSDNTLLLAGTAEPFSTVTVTRSGAGAIGTATSNAQGVWSFDASATALADGHYLFTARATDRAGNVSAASADFPVTIDTAAPVITAASASGGYRATFAHTIAATGEPASFTASGLPSGLTLNAATGEITGAPGQTGTFTVALTATDIAGNTGHGTLTLTIEKAPLTVAGIAATSKVYDGTFTAALSFANASLVGVAGSDNVTLVGSSAAGTFASRNVGASIPVAVTGLALSGADAVHYVLTPPTLAADITPRPLAIAADAQTKTYGAADPALTYAITDGTLVAGETLAGALARTAGENVGSYAITQASLSAGANYAIAFTPAALAITPAPLTVVADAKTKVYGAADPVFTYAVSGLQFSDTAASVLSGALTRVAGEAVKGGPYAIQRGTLAANPNYALTYTAAHLTITPATATITVTGYTGVYDGKPHGATGTATGVAAANLASLLDLGASFTAVPGGTANWTFRDPAGNYGDASGSVAIVITKAAPTIAVTPYSVIYDGAAHTATGTAKGVLGETLAGLNLAGTTHTQAGTYTDTWTFTDLTGNYANASGSITNKIDQAPVTLAFANLTQPYDGQPTPVTVTTTPANIPVKITYEGSATPPTLPGSYDVLAEVTDPNYKGTLADTLRVTITSLVRHAPTLNGDLDGSLQVLLPESFTLNSGAMISGDLLVPGTPTVRLNGQPTFGGTIDSSGAANPSSHQITLNGNAVLRKLVRRVDALEMPVVAPPAPPAGTRTVQLNRAVDPIGDWATVRDLTVSGSVGNIALPAGTYGNVTVNANNTLTLGIAGSTTRAVYDVQNLTVNANAAIKLVGPVTLTLKDGVVFNGDAGDPKHAEWLIVRVASGGLTLNGNTRFAGDVIAPSGTVTVNGSSTLKGRVTADRLTLNGNGVIEDPAAP